MTKELYRISGCDNPDRVGGLHNSEQARRTKHTGGNHLEIATVTG